ncbi:MAG: hypothetical protein NC489_32525, partial [Ruminococcus flavefaciens]|nr:hypothetical protein [Ruminococcus flavefaciens]
MKFVDNAVVIDDSKRKIKICREPLHIFKNNIQKNDNQHEAGGRLCQVLVGTFPIFLYEPL